MPLYEYRCTACGQVFEKIQSFSAPEQSECPKCQSRSERLLSAPAIQFKGSGFYLTDYGKSGGGKGGAKNEGGSSESKPAAGSGESKASPAPASAPSSPSSSSSGASSGSTSSSS